MLYPQQKERSHRFMLALRTGLPLFLFAAILMFVGLSDYFQKIPTAFYIFAIIILATSIYFIFYMIYRGFDEQITDPITHTFTRQKVVSILSHEIEKYKHYSIILISIDNLFDVNSRYGTLAGDRVLRRVAKDAGNFFIEKGFDKFPIGHFAGGDFLIGLNGDKNAVKPFLEMMCIKFDDLVIDDIEVKVNGAIIDKSQSDDVSALIERLFELKAQEQDDITVSKTLEGDDFSLIGLENSVKYALEEEKFSLKYQPLLADEKIAQVSIKLHTKEGEILHQKNFMPVVKRLGYERKYDEIVIEKIIKACKKLKTDGLDDLSLAFNLTPSVVRNGRFKESFKQMVESANIDFSRLVIILSEKEIYANMKRYNDQLQEYRKLGVRFVLDNVGSMNASVEYLKRLNIDIIRLDKPFSKHIDSPIYNALLIGYQKMASEIKVKTWIKMVDTNEAKEYFQSLEMDYIQGNAISKIVSLDTLIETVE